MEQQVDLTNCASEPIHVPGAVQSHGALLAFGPDRVLVAYSANAEATLRDSLALGETRADSLFRDGGVNLPEWLWDGDAAGVPDRHFDRLRTDAGGWDVIAHTYRRRAIVEIEQVGAAGESVIAAGRAYQRLRSATTIEALLQRAVEALATLTGFDRVMGYRFGLDGSGEVVAEAKHASLEPFLGQRYPASDIPAQARRLYLLNTLRAVVDVQSSPVPLTHAAGEAPLDLSFADLRAVSPIHIEYLRNMGVGASMSVSLIVDGQLWGLLTCHHRTARQLSMDLRVACEGFAHTVSSRVQALVADERGARIAHAAKVQARLAAELTDLDEVLPAIGRSLDDMKDTLHADGLVVTYGSSMLHSASLEPAQAEAIARAVHAVGGSRFEHDDERQWPEAERDSVRPYIGALARRFDDNLDGWLIAVRREEEATINWGGNPHKPVEIGPNGPRLTPRGSFDLWVETVRGRSRPWLDVTRTIADELSTRLERFVLQQRAQLEQVRAHVLAMLGHDLRNPLQAINTAAWIIQKRSDVPTLPGSETAPLANQIRNSSTRMARLIGQSLDFTRLTNGLALSVDRRDVDLVALAREIADEFRTAYSDANVEVSGPDTLPANVDPDRFSQVISNLLSNARHHGAPGQAISLQVAEVEGHAAISVRNVGNAIPEDVATTLYTPFKRTSIGNARNTGGLGIGLYIVSEIVKEHGGTVGYRFEEPYVVFETRIPRGTR